jgi:hypothetical protein
MKLETFLKGLAPMKLNWNNPYELLWRVPLWVENGSVTAYMGVNLRRFYTPETLPAEIKQRLGYIGAAKEHANVGAGDLFISTTDVYHNKRYPKEYSDIGWRVSEHIYTVVLPLEVLEQMKGLGNEQHDT